MRFHGVFAACWLVALSLLLPGQGSLALAGVPLKEKLTYPEFQALVKQKVGEVKDLRPLWTKDPASPGRQTMFTGGAFRGLLLWLYDRLQDEPLPRVRRHRPPSVEDLLLQSDADLDLLAPNARVPEVEEIFPDWDVLDSRFFAQSAADGGAGLDRAAASPTRVHDPLRGLREFYDGKLVFHRREATHLDGNTQAALALRYLRFVKEFERALRPDARSLEEIRRIAARLRLPANVRESIHDSSSVRYWVKKALSKFVKAYPGEPAEALVRLREVGLLGPLGKRGYFADEIEVKDHQKLARGLAARGFTDEEIQWGLRMVLGRRDARKQIRLARVIGWNRTPEEESARIIATFRKGRLADQKALLDFLRAPTRNTAVLRAVLEYSETPGLPLELREKARELVAVNNSRTDGILRVQEDLLTRHAVDLDQNLVYGLSDHLAQESHSSPALVEAAVTLYAGDGGRKPFHYFRLAELIHHGHPTPQQFDRLFANAQESDDIAPIMLLLEKDPAKERLRPLIERKLATPRRAGWETDQLLRGYAGAFGPSKESDELVLRTVAAELARREGDRPITEVLKNLDVVSGAKTEARKILLSAARTAGPPDFAPLLEKAFKLGPPSQPELFELLQLPSLWKNPELSHQLRALVPPGSPQVIDGFLRAYRLTDDASVHFPEKKALLKSLGFFSEVEIAVLRERLLIALARSTPAIPAFDFHPPSKPMEMRKVYDLIAGEPRFRHDPALFEGVLRYFEKHRADPGYPDINATQVFHYHSWTDAREALRVQRFYAEGKIRLDVEAWELAKKFPVIEREFLKKLEQLAVEQPASARQEDLNLLAQWQRDCQDGYARLAGAPRATGSPSGKATAAQPASSASRK